MALFTALVVAATVPTLAQREPPADSPPASGTDNTPAATPFRLSGDEAWAAVEPDLPLADEPGAASLGGDGSSDVAAAELPAGRTLKRSRKSGSFLRGQTGAKPSGATWLRTTGALAGVVALIFLLGWGYRTVAGGRLSFAGRVKRPGVIEIISRTTLSPRHSLHLVRLGQRMVLVGMSNDALVALDVVDDADAAARIAGQAAGQHADSLTREFSKALERETREYGSGDDAPETAMPEERRLFDIKRQLAGTIQRVRAAVGSA